MIKVAALSDRKNGER